MGGLLSDWFHYILSGNVTDLLKAKGVKIYRTYIGEYTTSIEMTGASISVCKLDDEQNSYLDYPFNTPFICMK